MDLLHLAVPRKYLSMQGWWTADQTPGSPAQLRSRERENVHQVTGEDVTLTEHPGKLIEDLGGLHSGTDHLSATFAR